MAGAFLEPPWLPNCKLGWSYSPGGGGGGGELKEQRDRLRSAARVSNNNKATWEKFRAARNRLKELIKSTKRNFMERMLSPKKPKEVWKVIHRILHPSPQRVSMQPDRLNNFFASMSCATFDQTVQLALTTYLQT